MTNCSLQERPIAEFGLVLFCELFGASDDLGDFESVDVDSIRNKNLRVLLIDDDDDLRSALRFELSREFGAQVTDVNSGLAGINLVAEGRSFDLIFLDLRMKEMNGLETYQRLQPIVGEECLVVIMSAYSESTEWEQAKSLGVELVPKPIPEIKLLFLLMKAGAKPSDTRNPHN